MGNRKPWDQAYYQNHKEEQLVRTRAFARKRAGMLADIKRASGCLDCGYNAHPDALEFDHVRGEKVNNVSHMKRRAWSVVLEEIEKCEVVCANCHAVRTAQRRETPCLSSES